MEKADVKPGLSESFAQSKMIHPLQIGITCSLCQEIYTKNFLVVTIEMEGTFTAFLFPSGLQKLPAKFTSLNPRLFQTHTHTHKYVVYRAVLTFKITKLCNGDGIYFVIKCSRHLQLYYSTYIIYLGHIDEYYLLALYTMIWYSVFYNINKKKKNVLFDILKNFGIPYLLACHKRCNNDALLISILCSA